MKRTVLLVRAEQYTKLSTLAAQERVSNAEINRRAIDAYEPDIDSDDELELLAEVLLQSNRQAEQALNEAHQSVRKTLDYFARRKRWFSKECSYRRKLSLVLIPLLFTEIYYQQYTCINSLQQVV